MLKSIDISTSGLEAQRQRMNTIAANIANVNTTRDADGNVAPFQRRLVTFQQADSGPNDLGVGVTYQVEVDASGAPRRVYDPGHPDADQDGFVNLPNIDIISEFVNAIEASRAYEANVAAIETTKQMANQTLRILA